MAILASGGVSHTSDARISTSADETLSDWQLRIDAAQTKDSGIYECQVNTEPKINWPVTVHVEGTFHFVFPNYGSMLLFSLVASLQDFLIIFVSWKYSFVSRLKRFKHWQKGCQLNMEPVDNTLRHTVSGLSS